MLRRFHTLFEQKLSNLRLFLSSIFPKDKENRKSLDIELMEVGRKVPLNGVRNTNTKKIQLRKQNLPKNKETKLRGNFTPKDSKSIKILDIQFQEVGAKRSSNGNSKVNRQTDRHKDRHTYGQVFENP